MLIQHPKKFFLSYSLYLYRKREIQPYLIDERCKSIVQRFDLLFLLRAHHLDVGVDLQVEGRQQALVDRDAGDGWPQVRRAGAEARAGCAQ